MIVSVLIDLAYLIVVAWSMMEQRIEKRRGKMIEMVESMKPTIRRRYFGSRDPYRRSIQVIEAVLHSQCEDLGSDPKAREARLDRDQVVSLFDRVDDGLDVHRLDRSEVDHLSLDAVLGFEPLGRHEGLSNTPGQRHDGHVLACSFDLGLSKLHRDRVLASDLCCIHPGDLFRDQPHTGRTKSFRCASSLIGKACPYNSLPKATVSRSMSRHIESGCCILIFQDDDRIRVPDGSLQETLGVLGAPWADHLEARNATVPCRVILRVLRGHAGSETVGSTKGDIAGLDAARHVQRLGGGVDDLIDGLHGEVERHEFTLMATLGA